jgi:serine phosphatase RsbU (regulator of sigma subunit)/anti-sigma regulatory factor (Ser/Thr protein kinase)
MPGKRKKTSSDAGRAPENGKELSALQQELKRATSLEAQLRKEISDLKRSVLEGESARSTVAELSRELHHRTRRLEQELVVARQFQRLFMPVSLPTFPQAKLAVKYSASPRVGGDLYDVFDMGNSCVGIFIGDASGDGLPATLITAVAKMALDAFRQNEYSPRVIMDRVNGQVLRNTLDQQFLTAFLGVLDLETLRMKYVNASHPCPVVYGADRFELLDTEGLCCGMFDDPNYEEKMVQLRPGDRVLLYTRGLVEMCNDAGKAFEHHALYEQLRRAPDLDVGEMVERLADCFLRHLAGAEQMEDLTLIGLQLIPREVKEETVVIPSEPMQLNRVETLILNRLEALNYGERAIFGVRLAIEEAVINAIKHGNRMDKAKKVTITYSADQDECVISVADEGRGFDPGAVPDPTMDENLELPHGRGLVLMKAYMDDVSHNEKGNMVTMRKKAPWRE